MNKNCILNLYDCDDTLHSYTITESKRAVLDDALTDGHSTITGGCITSVASGNSFCVDNCGTFNMYGGTILGFCSTDYSGGGVDNYGSGTFNMYGGAIISNVSKYGGGVSNYAGGTFTMYGGEISSNTAYAYGGGVFAYGSDTSVSLSGKPVIVGNTVNGEDSNLSLIDGTMAKVDAPLTNGANVGVGLYNYNWETGIQASDGIFTTSEEDITPADYAKYFKSDVADYVVVPVTEGEQEGQLMLSDHAHNWTYTASGATVTAKCDGEGDCDVTEGLTLTINAPKGSLVYDGKAKTATLSGDLNKLAFPGNYDITYKKGGKTVKTCVDAGTYTASVTVGGATASVNFTIAPKVVGLSWSNTSFIYNGKPHVPTAKATGLLKGDTCTVTVSGAQTNAGKHTAKAAKLSNGNYKLPAKNTRLFTIQKANQKAPAAPVITKITGTSITVQAVDGMEYSIDGTHWRKYGTFTNLPMGTAYGVQVRKAATTNYNVSPAVKVRAKTLTASTLLNLGFKMTQKVVKGKATMTVNYGRVPGATGYRVYFQYCGTNSLTEDNMITVPSGTKTSVSITEINKKALDPGRNCKVMVQALKGSEVIGTSRTNHMGGPNLPLHTNVKTITLKQTAVTLKATKTFTIKPTITKEDSNKELLPTGHGAYYRYVTTDSAVAAVNENGVITAKTPGTCIVCVIAQNGLAARINVTVK